MRLVTYNMRGGGSRSHWTRLLDVTDSDIAFVQETRAPSSLPADLLDARDYGSACFSAASHRKWGTALWLKEGGLGPMTLSGPTWWAAGGVVHTGGEEFFACSVHLAQASRGGYVGSAHAFLDVLADLGLRLPLVVAGDWNLAPCRRQAGETLQNTKGELALIERLEREFGLVSAWSHLNPSAALPQTLRWRSKVSEPYHCDVVLVSTPLHARVREARVLADAGWTAMSDHNPVVVELE